MSDEQFDVREWWEEGKAKGATHMLVVRDGFHNEYYPVYVLPEQNVFLVTDEHRTDSNRMRTLVELYSYALPLETQFAEKRARHFDVDAPPAVLFYDLETLSRLSKYAGMLERLLGIRSSLLTHPQWLPAVQACVAGLQGIFDEPRGLTAGDPSLSEGQTEQAVDAGVTAPHGRDD